MFDLIGFRYFVREVKHRCKSSIYVTVWGAGQDSNLKMKSDIARLDHIRPFLNLFLGG